MGTTADKASYVGNGGEAPAATGRIRVGVFVLLRRIVKCSVECPDVSAGDCWKLSEYTARSAGLKSGRRMR